MKLSKLYSVVEFEFYEEKLYEIKITYPDKMATEDDYRNQMCIRDSLNAVGDFVEGEFNTTTKTFTEAGSVE